MKTEKIPNDFYQTLPIDTPIIIRQIAPHRFGYDNLANKLEAIEKSTTNRKEVWHKAYMLLKNS